MSYDDLLAMYFGDPCKCPRCKEVLPFIHALDHLCDKCFDADLVEVVDHITKELKEVRNGSKEALKKAVSK